jgi:hypothetical protein
MKGVSSTPIIAVSASSNPKREVVQSTKREVVQSTKVGLNRWGQMWELRNLQAVPIERPLGRVIPRQSQIQQQVGECFRDNAARGFILTISVDRDLHPGTQAVDIYSEGPAHNRKFMCHPHR